MKRSIACKGPECPICKVLGPPKKAAIPLLDQETGETVLLETSASLARKIFYTEDEPGQKGGKK